MSIENHPGDGTNPEADARLMANIAAVLLAAPVDDWRCKSCDWPNGVERRRCGNCLRMKADLPKSSAPLDRDVRAMIRDDEADARENRRRDNSYFASQFGPGGVEWGAGVRYFLNGPTAYYTVEGSDVRGYADHSPEGWSSHLTLETMENAAMLGDNDREIAAEDADTIRASWNLPKNLPTPDAGVAWVNITERLPPPEEVVWCRRAWVAQTADPALNGPKSEVLLASRGPQPLCIHDDPGAYCYWTGISPRKSSFSDTTVTAWAELVIPTYRTLNPGTP